MLGFVLTRITRMVGQAVIIETVQCDDRLSVMRENMDDDTYSTTGPPSATTSFDSQTSV